jgi:hypothetical protein
MRLHRSENRSVSVLIWATCVEAVALIRRVCVSTCRSINGCSVLRAINQH